MKRFEFTVTGKGMFPITLLSVEKCFPVDTESAASIEWSFNLARNKTMNPNREVRLASIRRPEEDMKPDSAAWEDYDWKVKEVHRD